MNSVNLQESRLERGITPRTAALIGGIGYIVLFVLAIFANFLVKEGLIIHGDAAATAQNILNSEGLFRTGMVSFLLVFLIDTPIAWALFVLLRPIHRDLSLLAAWFRIVYTIFLGVALVFYYQALLYLDGGIFASSFKTEQLHALALMVLESFDFVWLIGLTAFGVHLILVGFLLIRSASVPRVLGWILILAGVSYIIDTSAHIILPDYSAYAGLFLALVALPSMIGEGWFGLWLLLRGGKNSLI